MIVTNSYVVNVFSNDCNELQKQGIRMWRATIYTFPFCQLCLSESSASVEDFSPLAGPHKQHLIRSPVTGCHYLKGKPTCDGQFQFITQCDNRRVDKGTVITQPPFNCTAEGMCIFIPCV
ncbi:hypothetical protein AVEN_150982-1 [Araneus ventricosus]|uniref:Uncharacterized protein n=1 Tax=Araneus ventricosus TaxID=182803 RepID=A0A4Y2JRV3_ARAVE|nr:hypothetical protein AVEN_150982-1 [Araneus ventricosus]